MENIFQIQVLDLTPKGRKARRCLQDFAIIGNEKLYDCNYSMIWLSWENINFRYAEVLYFLHVSFNRGIRYNENETFGEFNFKYFIKQCNTVISEINQVGFDEILLRAHVYFNQSDKELARQRNESFAAWRVGETSSEIFLKK